MSMHRPVAKGRGEIQLIIGPMFSGKSTELLRRLRRCQFAMLRCLMIKYANDDRYDSDMFSTHDGTKVKAAKCQKLEQIEAVTAEYDVIGIDEGQFFPDIVDFSENQANKGKIVIIAALDGTYLRTPFPKFLDLIPLAESVVKLNAICMNCRAEAAFTRRLGSETKLEVIGGEDKYMSVCRICYRLPDIKSPHKAANRKMPLNHSFDPAVEPTRKKLFKEGAADVVLK